MKLAGEHGPALERGDERNAVRRPSRRPSRRALAQRVGVRERRDARKQQASFWFRRHTIPAEMWDPHVRRQPATGSSDNTESRNPQRFVTRLAQHLHAETNAEDWRAA